MKLKEIIRTVIFLLLVGVVLYFLCDLFEYGNNYITKRYKTYKELEDNTVDAVFIGTSGVDRSWIAPKAYDEVGITVYPFSVDALPSWLVLDMVKEARRYQNPKLYIIDMRCFASPLSPKSSLSENRARRVIDMLNFFSPNRFDAIRRTISVMDEKYEADEEYTTEDLTYYLSFLKYHDKWNEEDFTFEDIGSVSSAHMGMYFVKKFVKQKKISAITEVSGTRELDEINARYLEELLEYAKEENLQLLFVDTPHKVSDDVAQCTNMLCSILDAEGIPYVNTNTDEWLAKLNLNFKTDFYEKSHTNYYGAEKFTAVFEQYLAENYQLPDRRTDESCKSDWDGIYAKSKKTLKKYAKSYADKDEDYDMSFWK